MISVPSALDWQPDLIAIFAKRQGRKAENRQLVARTAAAAALWHLAAPARPHIAYVASDVHGSEKSPDAEAVRELLVERFGVPAERVLIRRWSNCTIIEVRGFRVLCNRHRWSRVLGLTHDYHAARASQILHEVLPEARILSLSPDSARAMAEEGRLPHALAKLEDWVVASMPGPVDATRERTSEGVLGVLRRIDRRGRLERWMANRTRPTTA